MAHTPQLPFRDRSDAGAQLGEALLEYAGSDTVVLGLPRGGVPVAAAVARKLRAPLGVLLVRKLGVPWQPELAFGAVASGGAMYMDYGIARSIPEEQSDEVLAREKEELRRREEAYGEFAALPVEGRTVILVDDGLATGATMVAGLRAMRSRNPLRIVVAAPAASTTAASACKAEQAETVFLSTPEPFMAVGCWYLDFSQVSESEVMDLLRSSSAPPAAAPPPPIVPPVPEAGSPPPPPIVAPVPETVSSTPPPPVETPSIPSKE